MTNTAIIWTCVACFIVGGAFGFIIMALAAAGAINDVFRRR